MFIKETKFITSAADERGFLRPDKPLIAVCGRSNVGKSSLLNFLAGRKNLAKTSSQPGRTRLVNYFDFGEFLLADLPGYGYAAVSKEEKARWGRLLDAFFSKKEEISHVLALMDIRHEPTADDRQMLSYLNYHIIPFTVVATKSDKLSRMRRMERVRALAASLGLGVGNLLAVSSQTGEGKDALLSVIREAVAYRGGSEAE